MSEIKLNPYEWNPFDMKDKETFPPPYKILIVSRTTIPFIAVETFNGKVWIDEFNEEDTNVNAWREAPEPYRSGARMDGEET